MDSFLKDKVALVEVRYHDRVKVLQGLFAQDAHSPTCSPFDRPEYFALLEETGLKPFIARTDKAALPMIEEAGRLTPLRNWYSFTWRPLCVPGNEPQLSAIAKTLKSRAHRATFEPVPEEDGSATLLAKAFAEADWRVEVTQCDTNHILNLNGQSYAEYWADRPGPLRTTLKRKARKVEVKVLTEFDPALWKAYEAIYASSWKPSEDHPAILRKFAQQESVAGRLRFGMARQGDTPVAAQFWTVENDIAYIHKLAYLESARKLSAGTTLSAALFEHVIDRDRVRLVDFGTGDQNYKADWMNATRPRFRIDCLNMRSLRAWTDLARQTFSRLRESDVPKLAPFPLHG